MTANRTAYRIAVVPGDGIGPEVIAEALKVARAAGAHLDTVEYDLGGKRYLATGEVLPDSVLEELRGADAILLGAVGAPEVPPGVLERGLLLRLRFELDLYVNLRPFRAPASVGAGALSTLRSCARTPRALMPARAASSGKGLPPRSPPRVRSTPATGWSAA